jgi:spore germination cell wall hydrolase CwlJ-like protein
LIGAAALVCLTQAIYFESRGEPILGQYAVAEVVMNRVASDEFPDDVCAVTHHDRGIGARDCQFSYECDGAPEEMNEEAARRQAERIAYIVSRDVTDVVGDSLYFHSDSVSPRWANRFTLEREIGSHLFYTP